MIARISGENNLGWFGLTEYDKVADAFKKRAKRKISVSNDQYVAVRNAYTAYVKLGNPIVTEKTVKSIGTTLTKFVRLSPGRIMEVLYGLLSAAEKFPKIADIVDPRIAGKRTDPDKPENPIEKIVKEVAITAVIISIAVIASKYQKLKGL